METTGPVAVTAAVAAMVLAVETGATGAMEATAQTASRGVKARKASTAPAADRWCTPSAPTVVVTKYVKSVGYMVVVLKREHSIM